MKNRKFGDAKIMGILRQDESGIPVTELCREHGMSNASFYKWRSKFGGMDASMMAERVDTKDCTSHRKSIPHKILEDELGVIVKSLQPKRELFALARAMFKNAWEQRKAQVDALFQLIN